MQDQSHEPFYAMVVNTTRLLTSYMTLVISERSPLSRLSAGIPGGGIEMSLGITRFICNKLKAPLSLVVARGYTRWDVHNGAAGVASRERTIGYRPR
jgi:hypothetical protein